MVEVYGGDNHPYIEESDWNKIIEYEIFPNAVNLKEKYSICGNPSTMSKIR